jgi:hypothetical protein
MVSRLPQECGPDDGLRQRWVRPLGVAYWGALRLPTGVSLHLRARCRCQAVQRNSLPEACGPRSLPAARVACTPSSRRRQTGLRDGSGALRAACSSRGSGLAGQNSADRHSLSIGSLPVSFVRRLPGVSARRPRIVWTLRCRFAFRPTPDHAMARTLAQSHSRLLLVYTRALTWVEYT